MSVVEERWGPENVTKGGEPSEKGSGRVSAVEEQGVSPELSLQRRSPSEETGKGHPGRSREPRSTERSGPLRSPSLPTVTKCYVSGTNWDSFRPTSKGGDVLPSPLGRRV